MQIPRNRRSSSGAFDMYRQVPFASPASSSMHCSVSSKKLGRRVQHRKCAETTTRVATRPLAFDASRHRCLLLRECMPTRWFVEGGQRIASARRPQKGAEPNDIVSTMALGECIRILTYPKFQWLVRNTQVADSLMHTVLASAR